MEKSIKNLFLKLKENSAGTSSNGFAVLKNIRGGNFSEPDPGTNSASLCTNSYTCSGSNSKECTNSGKCESSSNTGTCTNSGTCFA